MTPNPAPAVGRPASPSAAEALPTLLRLRSLSEVVPIDVDRGLSQNNQNRCLASVEGEGADLDRVETLGPAEDTQEDVVDHRVGPQKVPTLVGAAGDFDERTFFGDEADWS